MILLNGFQFSAEISQLSICFVLFCCHLTSWIMVILKSCLSALMPHYLWTYVWSHGSSHPAVIGQHTAMVAGVTFSLERPDLPSG